MLTCVHRGFWWEDLLPTISDIQIRSEGSFGASTCDYLRRCQQQLYSLNPQRSSSVLSTVGLRKPLRRWGIALLIWQMFLACQDSLQASLMAWGLHTWHTLQQKCNAGMHWNVIGWKKLVDRLWQSNSEMLMMLCQANNSKEKRLGNTGATSDRRKFRSQTSDYGQMEKQRWEESEEKRRRGEERRSEKRRVRRKKMQAREKVETSHFTVFFQWYVSEGRLAKAAGAEPSGQMRDEKLHAVVARSTFQCQTAQNTSCLDHFWKLRCQKSACRCGAKRVSKSKCTKHTRSGPLLEVEVSKKCTPLWREAHCRVKSVKNWRVRSTSGRSDVVLRGRHKGFCTLSKVSKTWWFCCTAQGCGGSFKDRTL